MAETEWAQLARDALQRSDHRVGGARRAVIDLLGRLDCCLSPQEIAERSRRRGDPVGIASVYRALDLLRELGLVQRVDLGEGGYRYEAIVPGGEHHHHAVCDRCGQLTAFEDPGLERAIGRLERNLGHTVAVHEVVLWGECSSCVRDS